jgi:voltage-gated potassium channel Kch
MVFEIVHTDGNVDHVQVSTEETLTVAGQTFSLAGVESVRLLADAVLTPQLVACRIRRSVVTELPETPVPEVPQTEASVEVWNERVTEAREKRRRFPWTS